MIVKMMTRQSMRKNIFQFIVYIISIFCSKFDDVARATETYYYIRTMTFIEEHPTIQKIKYQWRLVGIMSAFVNRCLLSKTQLKQNVSVHDKKIDIVKHLGEPAVFNMPHVDVFNYNLFRHVHQTMDMDFQYLRDHAPPDTLQVDSNHLDIHPHLKHLLVGFTTLNEQLVNFISTSYEKLFDLKVKKIIDFFVRQRRDYLTICRIKFGTGVNH
jgi:hypothetical protein